VPVPVSVITVGELVALLATLTFAFVTAPPVVGANVTVSVADWPGVKMVPFATPLAVNPAPVVATPEIVTAEFPLFVSVDVCDAVLPSFTFPKPKLAGLAPSNSVDATPVPDRLIVIGDGVPFVVRVIEPLIAAVDVGAKIALKLVLPPAAIVVVVESPVWLMPAPATVICENVIVALPLFVSVIGCELLLPIVTFPKATLAGFAEICG
jgi:hypothetical protein